MIDYKRVARAIKYINEHATEQPNLDDIAEAVHLSPYHFHRMFKEWAGVTPKEFLQFISLDRAKKLLAEKQTIEEATFKTGLSSTSRLHDLFVNIEGMTPGEFKNGGRTLEICYHLSESPFGDILIASTGKGICSLQFVESPEDSLEQLQSTWHNADLRESKDNHIENLENVFSRDWENLDKIKLHIQGTDFQLKVWEALLKIPTGRLTTYSDIAGQIGNPNASRAVGAAVGRNPVAYLIPCHRVIKKVGGIGEYRWGSARKKAIIGWEAAKEEAG
ncbi:methylated-DNA--[protein]-cysteine S-methyltransferase [Aliifodinibius sp. S!AR15-10]|nr:methylated-DNA--[protein]-cysteine S-methyltransferase [Aliifodinibius sp. S!AR15-10]MDR8391382.1 methylated-DNA--[protein]-cysteine S-methyltransferase [Aliifodinibius sp. S!AR15-10]